MSVSRLGIIALAVIPYAAAQSSAQPQADPFTLVRQLAQFPAAIDPRIQSSTGSRMPAAERRAAIHVRLRALGASAVPALVSGLTDADVQIRRNVALFLGVEGANFAKHAPERLDLTPFLPQLIIALRDDDQRVKELSAQALEHVGPAAVRAVPDLVRLLADPSEALRNSACIGLAGIGPAARGALPALHRALTDPSLDVRRFARRAIDRIAVKPTPGGVVFSAAAILPAPQGPAAAWQDPSKHQTRFVTVAEGVTFEVHHVFLTREAEPLREIHAFIAGLDRAGPAVPLKAGSYERSPIP